MNLLFWFLGGLAIGVIISFPIVFNAFKKTFNENKR